jgi:hypothetical protein
MRRQAVVTGRRAVRRPGNRRGGDGIPLLIDDGVLLAGFGAEVEAIVAGGFDDQKIRGVPGDLIPQLGLGVVIAEVGVFEVGGVWPADPPPVVRWRAADVEPPGGDAVEWLETSSPAQPQPFPRNGIPV